MAYWRTGDTARARATFDAADRWLRGYETRWKMGLIPYPRTLRRLRDEAAALLKVDEPAPDRKTGVNPEPPVG
jgi:hypothetical protein